MFFYYSKLFLTYKIVRKSFNSTFYHQIHFTIFRSVKIDKNRVSISSEQTWKLYYSRQKYIGKIYIFIYFNRWFKLYILLRNNPVYSQHKESDIGISFPLLYSHLSGILNPNPLSSFADRIIPAGRFICEFRFATSLCEKRLHNHFPVFSIPTISFIIKDVTYQWFPHSTSKCGIISPPY